MTADHSIDKIQNLFTRAQRSVWMSRISTLNRIVFVKLGQPPVVNIIFNPPKTPPHTSTWFVRKCKRVKVDDCFLQDYIQQDSGDLLVSEMRVLLPDLGHLFVYVTQLHGHCLQNFHRNLVLHLQKIGFQFCKLKSIGVNQMRELIQGVMASFMLEECNDKQRVQAN
jgi:hypothetical protein